MKKCIYIIIAFFVFIFIDLDIIAAVSASDYRVGKFVYYDPIKNSPCVEDSYWSIYNQGTTCYRWAIIDTNEETNKIRILLDHDIGLSTYDDRHAVFSAVKQAWDNDYIDESSFGSLGNKKVLSLYNGNNPNMDKSLYEINSSWESVNPTSVSYYNKIAPNSTSFIYSNIYFRDKDINNNNIFYDYNIFDKNYSYTYSELKSGSTGGYWLSDSIGINPFGSSDSANAEFEKYAFYMNAKGNVQLALKTQVKGVRPSFWINIAAFQDKAFKEVSFNLFSKTLVADGTTSSIEMGEKNQTLGTNTSYYPQGFTVVGQDKGFMYLAPRESAGLYEDENNGVLLSFNGSSFKQSLLLVSGHGNGMHFNRGNSKLYLSGIDGNLNMIDGINLNTLEPGDDTNVTTNTLKSSVFAIDDEGKYLFTMNSEGRIYAYDLSNNIPMYFFDTNVHGTKQGMAYLNGYLYFVAYESCLPQYQNYCYGVKDSLYLSVYNVKFNPDGTPNRWFGQNVRTYVAEDMNTNTKKHYEIEGIGAYENSIYLGFALINKNDSNELDSYVPAIYKYTQSFYDVVYNSSGLNYSEKIFPGKFVDMRITLGNQDYSKGFIGWKDQNDVLYSNPNGTSIRANDDVLNDDKQLVLNGVYIEPTNDYTFNNDDLNISKRANVKNILDDIKAYNCSLKVYSGETEITSLTNEYIKYNDILKVIYNGEVIKSYNLKPSIFEITYEYNNEVLKKEYESNSSINLITDISRTGYELLGWEYQNVTYKSTDEFIMPNKDITISAVWEANKYTIEYNANTGSGTMESSIHTYDVEQKLNKNTFVKSGYIFKGWSTTPAGFTKYQDEQIVKNLKTSGSITLYASWQEVYEENIDEIINKKYEINNNKIYKIAKRTGISSLELGLNNNYIYKIYDETNTTELNKDYIGTGNLLKIYKNNTLLKEYRVIIKGDLTGEGEIEVNDVARLYQYIKGKTTMSDYYIEASNVETTNNELAVSDVAKLYQYIKGKITSLED